jgi:hypothetical protein
VPDCARVELVYQALNLEHLSLGSP